MKSLSTVVTTAVAVIVVAPIAVVLASVFADSGGLWSHLESTVLPGYFRNTLLLAAGVAVLSVALGVPTAWLVTMCRFPGSGWLSWALLLPLAIPAYLDAYAYTDLLQFSGPVQSWLRELFGWQGGDYWFPQVRSLSGATVLLSMALYPYVYMAARAAFREQSTCTLEASRTLGQGPWRSFVRVALPLARPSIAAGLSLVLMETVAEFGAVQYCAVDTFATGIYRTFTLPNQFSLIAAGQLSAVLLALVLVLIIGEASVRRRARFFATTNRRRDLPVWQLGGLKAGIALFVCLLPVVVGFLVPTALFASHAWRAGDQRAREMFWEMGRNSFILAGIAALVAVVLALVLSSAVRFRGSTLVRVLVRAAGLGYAVPGTVLAIGVLGVITRIDRPLSSAWSALVGSPTGLLLSGTAIAVLYGYQSRFLAVSLNLVRAGMTRISPSMDGAARTLGSSPLNTLLRVHLPLLRGTLFAAAILVFVDVVKELPATLMLRPFGLETLSVRVYQLASDERLGEAASGALAIIGVGLLPVLVLSWLIDRSRAQEGDAGIAPITAVKAVTAITAVTAVAAVAAAGGLAPSSTVPSRRPR